MKTIAFLSATILVVCLCGCEDDPVLSPTGDDCIPDSYTSCEMSLQEDNSGNRTLSILLNQQDNPESF